RSSSTARRTSVRAFSSESASWPGSATNSSRPRAPSVRPTAPKRSTTRSTVRFAPKRTRAASNSSSGSAPPLSGADFSSSALDDLRNASAPTGIWLEIEHDPARADLTHRRHQLDVQLGGDADRLAEIAVAERRDGALRLVVAAEGEHVGAALGLGLQEG